MATPNIIFTLRKAIDDGVQRTRKQWAFLFQISYHQFCTIIREHRKFEAACTALRAESGVIAVGHRKDAKTVPPRSCIRIPSCALRAAGITSRQVSYFTAKGMIVIIDEAVAGDGVWLDRKSGRISTLVGGGEK